MIGKTLAHYRIVEKIGAGGMGEVWRASDSKLGRDVALKMLPAEFARDAERMVRLQREAQVLASLNHPGIGAIYGLEEIDDARFLVLELIEGPTLFDRIQIGPIPLEETLGIARQIAEAVEFAHESGVVHRDLKPANVKVTGDGRVKVLDFGLAKAMADPAASSSGSGGQAASPTLSPTLQSPITGALTGANVLLGTAAYMSPEQARGKAVDKRSDIWSFGVILFEMLTGRRLFEGETVSDTIASILKTEPDWSKLPPKVPGRLRELLERCLTRDPRRRLRDMGDVRIELERIREGRNEDREAARAQAEVRRCFGGLPGIAAAALVGAFVGILLWSLRSHAPADSGEQAPSRLSIVVPDDLAVGDFMLSPDGRTLAIEASHRNAESGEEERGLWLRDLDDYEAHLVPGSRSVSLACFSPDGQWLAVVAPESEGSTKRYLWKTPVSGDAPPLKLLGWNDAWSGIHWLPDGDLVTGSPAGEIVRVPTDGQSATESIPVVAEGIDIESTVDPVESQSARLPDGYHLLSMIETWGEQGYGQNIVVLDVRTGETKVVMENGASPRWSDTGHLLFSRSTALLAVPFDPERLTVTGGPVALADDLRIPVSWGHGDFDVSAEGTLVYLPGGFVGGDRRLAWMDRDFHETAPWSEDRFALEWGPLVSPDGKRFTAVFAGPDGVYDVWMSEPDRPVLRKWLEEPNQDCLVHLWSPDGSKIVFQSRTARETRHFIRSVDEANPVLLFVDREQGSVYRPFALVDDDSTLLMIQGEEDKSRMVMLAVSDAGDGPPTAATLLEDVQYAKMSPDGRWLAYRSNASGRQEVYSRRWNGSGRIGPERRVSIDGATSVSRFADGLWWYTPADGAPLEIWYLDEREVYAVALRSGPEATLSRPRPIAVWRREYRNMDTLPDGRLLMCLYGEEEGPVHHVQVVRGWKRELD